MRQANLIMMSAAMLLAACGGTKDAGKTDQVLIEKSDIKIEGKRMTPEALWAMGRIGGFAVSPDGKKIAYTVAYYSVPENKSNREVFVMNADGSENQQITHTPYQENEVTWIKGGTKLAFLSNDNGSSQLYEMNPDGSGRKQLTNYDVNSGADKRIRVHVDAENYRAKREQSLERLANKVAAKVVKYRRSVTLEPMNAYERHVIHTALQDVPGITTYSTGVDPNRRVIVAFDRESK